MTTARSRAAILVLTAALGACRCAPDASRPEGAGQAAAPSAPPTGTAPAAVGAPGAGAASPPAAGSQAAPEPAPLPGFLERSTRLATVPKGYEAGEILFSGDGRHVLFAATREGKTYAFLDDRQLGPFEEVGRPATAPGRGALAFPARRDGTWVAVLDGREGAGFDELGALRLAAAGPLVYSAKRGGGWRVVAGDRELAVAGEPDPAPFTVAGGRKVAFVEQAGPENGSRVVICDLALQGCYRSGAYDELSNPKADGAGRRLAFQAGKGGKQLVLSLDLIAAGVTERASEPYDGIHLLELSSEGGHLAFLAVRQDRMVLVIDGKERPHPSLDMPLDLRVSSSGRAFVTGVEGSQVGVLEDGAWLEKDVGEANSPELSRDGTGLALAVGPDGKNRVLLKGGSGPTFDKVVTPRFSPDGVRVVYRARRSGERFVVEADAKGKTLREHPRYQAVWDVAFSPDGRSVGYGVRKGQELWWRVEPLTSP